MLNIAEHENFSVNMKMATIAGLFIFISRENFMLNSAVPALRARAECHKTRPQGFRTFFMLSSAEHEICPANLKYSNCKIFLLNIAEHENFSTNKYECAKFCWHFHIY